MRARCVEIDCQSVALQVERPGALDTCAYNVGTPILRALTSGAVRWLSKSARHPRE